MRVLLAPHGTRGDVQPMLAFGIALRKHGHDVRFVVPANFVDGIRRAGFPAESDGIDVEATLLAPRTDLQSVRFQTRYITEVLAPRLFDSVARAVGDADVIVGAGVQIAAASVAERQGVPCVNAAFCPCAVPSRTAPPPMVHVQNLPQWVNALLWRLGSPIADAVARGPINAGRASLGLPPVRSPMRLIVGGGAIVAADRELAPIGDDVAAKVVQTDAWILEDQTPLAPDVDAFLRAGPPPVYVGFGSMVSKSTEGLAAQVLSAARMVGCRLLIAGGWARLGTFAAQSADIMAVDSLPHQTVLHRTAAAVHHGGAGTTTAAARAGVPQVLLPHILDQFYWGHRIAVLGLGPRPLPVSRVTSAALADRLRQALGEARIRARAQDLAARLAGRNGVEFGVNHLVELVETRCRA